MLKRKKYKKKFWSREELDFLIEKYPLLRTDAIAKALERPHCSVYNKAHELGVYKSLQFKQSPESGILIKGTLRGSEYRFPKGHEPWNKNVKGIHLSTATEFKPGQKPKNTLYDGAIQLRTSKKKGEKSYYWIRIANAKWVCLHVHIWESANGKVPKGFLVVFKDRNTLNCNLDNLELIDRAENMRRNTIHRYPVELKKTIRIVNKLKRTINGTQQN